MPKKELVRLLAGFKRFRQKYYSGEESVFQRLTQNGQSPKTLIIGCCDSRVDPAILTSAEPGDLFIVRNVANLVPPFEEVGKYHGVSAAIEFAVVGLRIENVVILGHGQCGGIRALMSGIEGSANSFIANWVNIAEEAKLKVIRNYSNLSIEKQCYHCELESIRISLQNLRSFPFVQKAVRARQLNIVGAYFDLEAGRLLGLNEATGQFEPIEG